MVNGQQSLDIDCTQMDCDITLRDSSWSSCKASTGQSFNNGVGIAKGVPRGSLSDFDIELYCLEEDRSIDYDREPDATLQGNLAHVRDGIIRTGPGTNYIKSSPNEVEEPFSVYQDFALTLTGLDTEDGSEQFLEILCEGGLCDVELTDTYFSTCVEAIPGDRYLGGLAKAAGVPQDSLYDFNLPLYCASDLIQGIDYSAPAATLKGNLVFPQPGNVKRIGPGFMYYNLFKGTGDDRALALPTAGSSLYQGYRQDTGGLKLLSTSCQNKNCEVILFSVIEPLCIGPSGGRLFLNAVAINKNVPQDSLDNFEIGLYCVPPGAGAVIDYNTQEPILTMNASITPGDRSGTIRLVQNPEIYDDILFKLSAGE